MKKMTFADWLKSSYIPALNETCVCVDTHEIRYGDGVNPWIKLGGDINVDKSVNEALAQAKESGEFDGKDGVSVSHSWNGTTLTISSASGTSSANLKGDKGDTGANGKDGANGTSVTVSNVSESTVSGGSNIVTFSDGKKITVKNGINGTNGTDGKTPVKGTDYFTASDKTEMVNAVISALPKYAGGVS